MDAFLRRVLIFLIGGLGYFCLEIIYRGYSHWTMFLTGGIAFLCLFTLFTASIPLPFWARCIAGGLIVTSIEFVVGVIVNKWLGWDVWDYSSLPFNLFGQISLSFSLIWLVICIPIGFLCRLVHQSISNKPLMNFIYSFKSKESSHKKIHP